MRYIQFGTNTHFAWYPHFHEDRQGSLHSTCQGTHIWSGWAQVRRWRKCNREKNQQCWVLILTPILFWRYHKLFPQQWQCIMKTTGSFSFRIQDQGAERREFWLTLCLLGYWDVFWIGSDDMRCICYYQQIHQEIIIEVIYDRIWVADVGLEVYEGWIIEYILNESKPKYIKNPIPKK